MTGFRKSGLLLFAVFTVFSATLSAQPPGIPGASQEPGGRGFPPVTHGSVCRRRAVYLSRHTTRKCRNCRRISKPVAS